MTLIYIVLIIVVGLLIKLIFFPRDKGLEAQKHWNKLFDIKIDIPEYKEGDPRNKTHPDEIVRTKRGDLSHRKLEQLLDIEERKVINRDGKEKTKNII